MKDEIWLYKSRKSLKEWKSLKCGENEKAVDRQTCIEAPALYI